MASDQDPSVPGDGGGPPPGDSSGRMGPELTNFVSDQNTPMGQAWAGIAAQRAQSYLTARSNAIDAQQAADQTVTNLHQAKTGLVGMVQNDPGSMDLALDLAQHSVNGIVDQHGHLDEDTRQTAANSITDHMQSEIVHGGIQSLAETDKGAALKALDRYGDYLPDDQQAALRQYADVQEGLRGQDAVAQQAQQQRDASVAGYHAATNYMGALADPSTGDFRAPPNYLAQLVADPSIAAPTKLALRAGYQMLNRFGDAPQSDPHVVSDMVSRIADPAQPSPQQGEIISHLGSGLTIGDAGLINHLLGPSTPQRQADIRTLDDTLQQAKATLAHPANGPAGDIALGRFTNWLLPALRNGGNLNELAATNPVQRFAPTLDDYKTAVKRFNARIGS